MSELRLCINSTNNIFNYYLKWPHVTGKYKDKLDKIESELVKIGKDYSMLLDTNGDMRKKVINLQAEHTKVLHTKNVLTNTFWKVKDITEGRLEQMVEILRSREQLQQKITIPKHLNQIINRKFENNSLIILIGFAMDSWKKFLPEMKTKYKIIF